MAIYHYAVHKVVSRGAGKSAVRSAAYLCRERYRDERTNELHDYRPKESEIARASAYIDRAEGFAEGRKAALFTGLYGPLGAPEWTRGRENIAEFWNRLEQFEKHERAQIATPIDIALPHELTLDQNRVLIQDHIRERFVRRGFVVQLAIHEPEHGEGRNIHAHLLVSTRQVDERGFVASKAASREHFLHRSEYVQDLREHWEHVTNRHLERHGIAERIDRRTLREQGIDREPTQHLGPARAHAERQIARLEREVAAIDRERQAPDRAHQERQQQEPAREQSAPQPGQKRPWRQRPRLEPGREQPVAPPAAPDRAADHEQRAEDYVQELIRADRAHRQRQAAELEPPTSQPERAVEREAPKSEREQKLDHLRTLSGDALRAEAKVNLSKDFWHNGPLTALDIAREMAGYDPNLPQKLRTQAWLSDEEQRRHSAWRHHREEEWQQRREAMGWLARKAHDKGWWPDTQLNALSAAWGKDDAAAKAAERTARQQREDAALHERNTAAALKAAMPHAEVRLAELNERAALAQEVLRERQAPYRAMKGEELEQKIDQGRETLEDVARRLNPSYAATIDHVGHLQKDRQERAKSIAAAKLEATRAAYQSNQRWDEMNRGLALRAWRHYLGGEKLGLKRFKDRSLVNANSAWQAAQQRIATLTGEVNEIDQALPMAQKRAEQEFERIKPAAERERDRQRESARLAREVLGQRQEIARQRQIEHEREYERLYPRRSLGWDMGR